MPSLPPLDIKTKINHAPHVVILGAGASLASFPEGDHTGRLLPLMRNLIQVVGLQPLLEDYGITAGYDDFEALYDGLVSNKADPVLLSQLETQISTYFEGMRLPPEATIYDLLVLSLREKDVIATFNWDPFLAQAIQRNRAIGHRLPQILFLHGNVKIGVCMEHMRKGFVNQHCSICNKSFERSRLLFPVKQKDYTSDPFIKSEWNLLQQYLERAYLVTIFGYSAPVTDIEAKHLLLRKWRKNPTQSLAEIDIINTGPRDEIEETWSDFFVRQHYGIFKDIDRSTSFRHVRRSCEAFAMATLQQDPWQENPFPETRNLTELHEWLEPLLVEEEAEQFSGSPSIE